MNSINTHIIVDDAATLEEVKKKIFELLETVPDPEVPVLSVIDLGVVRNVELTVPTSFSRTETLKISELTILISVTPTYTGCPAIDVMKINIRMALLAAGFKNIIITETLSPAWTTDWMSEHGKEKIKSLRHRPTTLQTNGLHA
jgi:ring-1,2-phenylacetyl-CoA epoxidase subunit PaaD